MAWAKNGVDTLTGNADEVSFTMDNNLKFNTWLYHKVAPSGSVNSRFRLGSGSLDSGTNYAQRRNSDGGTDGTNINNDFALSGEPQTFTNDLFEIGYFVNIATEEKLIMAWVIEPTTAGAANAPHRAEQVAKWVNTSNQADTIGLVNTSTGDMTVDTNLSALGTD